MDIVAVFSAYYGGQLITVVLYLLAEPIMEVVQAAIKENYGGSEPPLYAIKFAAITPVFL